MLGLLINIIIILLTSLAIYFSGKYFAESSSKIGNYIGLSHSAKGATLDAISGSLPELSISLFSVLVFLKFEIGVGTIVGSALFNILIIPALCVFVAPVAFKISNEVIHRDGLFYNLTVIILLTAIFYSAEWNILIASAFIVAYLIYIFEIMRHGNSPKYVKRLKDFLHHGPMTRKYETKKRKKLCVGREVGILLLTMVAIVIASYFLVESSISLAELLSIPPIIIAFTVIAAATSLPDTVIAVINARKGNIVDATSNIFGSNIFDILIGLGLPILIAMLMGLTLEITVASMMVVFGLLASTVLVLYLFSEEMKLTKARAILMIISYFLILSYVIIYI